MTTRPPRRGLHDVTLDPATPWWPEVALAVLATVVASWDLAIRSSSLRGDPTTQTVAALLVLSLVLFRRAPGVALAVVWCAGLLQLRYDVEIMAVQLVVVVVAYGTARYGRSLVVWLGLLSVPLGALAAVTYSASYYGAFSRAPFVRALRDATDSVSTLVAVSLIVLLALLLPWFLGLFLRLRAQARLSEDEQERTARARDEALEQRLQAEEVAELRSSQARLARDVHDVVGHSLAVVLAQAESAQYLPDDDPAALKKAMASIATSARQSLQDVRQVLTSIEQPGAAGTAPRGTLDTLLDDLRQAGTDVVESVHGTPRPLPPELETVAYRVLQEMLTNALKHGRRGATIAVERRWGDGLTLVARNQVGPGEGIDSTATVPAPRTDLPQGSRPDAAAGEPDADAPGLGLAGMRRRLAGVGGRLAVRRDVDAAGTVHVTVTAQIPLGRGLRSSPPPGPETLS